MNYAKFLRTPFLQNTSGWLLLYNLTEHNLILFFFGNQENSAIQANDSAGVLVMYFFTGHLPVPWVFT